jgi:hypothetical protein
MKPISTALFFALTVGAGAQQLFEWSDWIPTTDASTEYRYEMTSETSLSLQFRNDNKAPNRFDYEIVTPGQDQPQHGNTSVKGRKVSADINVETSHGRPPSKVLVNSCEGAACRY